MNKIVSVASLALALALSNGALAEEGHVVNGLFCNTEAQLEETIAHIQRDVPPRAAAEFANRERVECVYADLIGYMIVEAASLGDTPNHGARLYKYEGRLVGVVVGDQARPVAPPVRMFFVVTTPLPGVVAASGA